MLGLFGSDTGEEDGSNSTEMDVARGGVEPQDQVLFQGSPTKARIGSSIRRQESLFTLWRVIDPVSRRSHSKIRNWIPIIKT